MNRRKQRLPWSNLVATATLNNSGISNDEVNCEFKDFSSAPDLTILRQSAVRNSIFRGSLSVHENILPPHGSVPGRGVGPRIQVIAQATSKLGGQRRGSISKKRIEPQNVQQGMSTDEVNCEFKDFSSAHDLTSLRHSAVRSSMLCGSLLERE